MFELIRETRDDARGYSKTGDSEVAGEVFIPNDTRMVLIGIGWPGRGPSPSEGHYSASVSNLHPGEMQ